MCICRYEDRQTEPKDRDLSKTRRRRLHASTYDRIGSVTDGVRNISVVKLTGVRAHWLIANPSYYPSAKCETKCEFCVAF